MNLLINLTRPEDYQLEQGARFVVTFDNSRGAHGTAVAPFVAHLTPDGWRTESIEGRTQTSTSSKLLDYVRLANDAGERVTSPNSAIGKAHVNRNAGLEAWADLLKRGEYRIPGTVPKLGTQVQLCGGLIAALAPLVQPNQKSCDPDWDAQVEGKRQKLKGIHTGQR